MNTSRCYLFFYVCILIVSFSSCNYEIESGCTDPLSNSFNPTAEEDDGSCTYERDDYLGKYKGLYDNNDDAYDGPVAISIEPSNKRSDGIVINFSIDNGLTASRSFVPDLEGKVGEGIINVSDSFDAVNQADVLRCQLNSGAVFFGTVQFNFTVEFSEDRRSFKIKNGTNKITSEDESISCSFNWTIEADRI